MQELSRIQQSSKHVSVNLRSIKLNNRKGEQIKLEAAKDIHKKNLLLLKKMHMIETKKKKVMQAPMFMLHSLNIKNRMNAFKDIENQNEQIVKRLRSQKSRYSTEVFQTEYKKLTSFSESIRKVKSACKRPSLSAKNKNFNSKQYEILPQNYDGFQNRFIIYTEILYLQNKSVFLEISKNRTFYYLFLDQFPYRRYYKLRVTISTGSHLMDLINKGIIHFMERIIKRGKLYILTIPYFPFIRSYTFSEFKKIPISADKEYKIKNNDKAQITKQQNTIIQERESQSYEEIQSSQKQSEQIFQ